MLTGVRSRMKERGMRCGRKALGLRMKELRQLPTLVCAAEANVEEICRPYLQWGPPIGVPEQSLHPH
jgi:hypothetical protein